MIKRNFWAQRIRKAWETAPIAWLSGVRRIGKTTLAKSFGDDVFYVNCDLPLTGEAVRDPELFYRNCEHSILVFDEIHQLDQPSRLLKIGADMFPSIKILATGSSTLAASKKFRDTLTGRKQAVHLTPVLWDELENFKIPLLKRLYHGGLPPMLLSGEKNPSLYREWMDSFFARDVQQLFNFRSSEKFSALFEYLIKQSGGLLEKNRAANALSISRPTLESYLNALQIMHAVTLLRPFYGRGQKEIVKMPKCYAFDTGFVSFCRGWSPLRMEDYGILWEHFVLEFLQAHRWNHSIYYWRDAVGREIDFVIPRNRDEIDVIECKWDPKQFEVNSLKVFRSYYPKGKNYIVSPIYSSGYTKQINGLTIRICNPSEAMETD